MKANQNNNQAYFKIYSLIALIIILIALIIVFNKIGQKESSGVTDTDAVEIMVRDATAEDSQTEKNNQQQSTDYQNLGPATVEDLGGSGNSVGIDELLKDKQIEVGK